VQQGSLVAWRQIWQLTFSVADGPAQPAGSYKGILPDLFREGQGRGGRGVRWMLPAPSRPTPCWPKHDENLHAKGLSPTPSRNRVTGKDDYGAKTVRSSGEAGCREPRSDRGNRAHYALVLAAGAGADPSRRCRCLAARRGDAALMNVARLDRAGRSLCFVGMSFTLLVTLHVISDFPSSTCSRIRIR